MNRNIKIVAAALCAALLAGCSGAAASSAAPASSAASAPASSAASAAASVSAPAESNSGAVSAASAAAAADYDAAALQDALDSCVNFEADTAGGSLKITQAAAKIVEFSTLNATVENSAALAEAAQEWYAGLDEAQAANLAANWVGIAADIEKITTDPAGMADQLDTAGVTTDFTAMNMDNAVTLRNCLNSLVNHSW